MKYLITIILILTLFTGCAVTRYSPEEHIFSGMLKQHPVRPDICPKENIEGWILPIHYMPGDAFYIYEWGHQYEHQRCFELYGGCSLYVIDKDIFSGTDFGCVDHSIDKETCLAKGGEWHNYSFIDFGRWCWWPFEE